MKKLNSCRLTLAGARRVLHALLLLSFLATASGAENPQPPNSKKLSASNLFPQNYSVNDVFSNSSSGTVTPEPAKEDPQAPATKAAEASSSSAAPVEKRADKDAGETNLIDGHAVSPNDLQLSKVNADAPFPFKAMVQAKRSGDEEGARNWADAYVRYMQNLMFEVREYTQMIGEAMIRNGVISEESWVGVGQYLDYQMAQARDKTGSAVKATEEVALKRITADPQGEVEIYYFFTLNSSYCRYMASDIERLWRVAKGDPKIKMVALTLGPQPVDWIKSYRTYTGLTVPIYEGAKVAKIFNIGFVPAVVIVSPTTKVAYLRTGQQTFDSLYRFVRTAQGLPTEFTPEVKKLMSTPIGQLELTGAVKPGGALTEIKSNSVLKDGKLLHAKNQPDGKTIERF